MAAFGLFVLVGLILAFPQPLFGHSMTHGGFQVWSDRPIDPAMADVLDDAARRLRTSEFYAPGTTLRIFICNEPWRLWLLTRSTSIGGATDTLVTRNIYLREADIAANRLVPPSGRLADAEARTLAYFIAHEGTHVLQSRRFGRLLKLQSPRWLIEGHADLVAKADDFDLAQNQRLFRQGDPRLDHGRSGLYRGYHLMVAALTRGDGRSIEQLFDDPPEETDVVRALLRGTSE